MLQIVEAQYEPIPQGEYSDKIAETVNRWISVLTGIFMAILPLSGRDVCKIIIQKFWIMRASTLI